jgi:hypothetical protein
MARGNPLQRNGNLGEQAGYKESNMTRKTLILGAFAFALVGSVAADAQMKNDPMMASGSDMKMSKSQMMSMKKCQAMSQKKMMKNRKCVAMQKMHSEMMSPAKM